MDRILNFGQFVTLVGILLLSVGAIILALPNAIWLILGTKIVSRDIAFLSRTGVPWAVSMGVMAIMLRERDVSDTEARAYLLALLIGSALAFLLALYGCVTGILNGFGWFAVVVFAAMAGLSGAFLREE
jgi:hypothetical protein